MEVIILWIVMIIFIVKISKKSKQQNQNQSQTYNGHSQGTSQEAPMQRTPQAKTVVPAAKTAMPEMQTAKTTKKQESVQREEGQSVTEYLHEKAMQDEAEHRKEKMREAMKERKYHGYLNTAQRLYPGDPVPANQRVSICPYCAAENLIPLRDTSKYHCYFCRHELK
ncbi:MAG: hypothetical protein IJ485_07020 [Lachnospiraceae bacterium]|nr:hypothetical protein [Lachnospiraceae bacterium]